MKRSFTLICLLAIYCISCEGKTELNPEGFVEHRMDIEGNWKIQGVTQNGRDVTAFFDFESFKLDLNYENGNPSTFAISGNTVPFTPSRLTGSWSFDDPVYPTEIHYSDGTKVRIAEPLLSMGDRLVLSVPMGCGANTYLYTLSKDKN